MRLDGLFHFALIHAGTAVHCGGEHCARYAHCAHCGEHFAHYAHCGEHCAHCGEQCAAVPLPGGSPQQQQQPVQVSRKPPYGGSEGMAEEYGSHIMVAQRELICFLATVDLSHCLDSTQTVFKSHISCLFSYVCLH